MRSVPFCYRPMFAMSHSEDGQKMSCGVWSAYTLGMARGHAGKPAASWDDFTCDSVVNRDGVHLGDMLGSQSEAADACCGGRMRCVKTLALKWHDCTSPDAVGKIDKIEVRWKLETNTCGCLLSIRSVVRRILLTLCESALNHTAFHFHSISTRIVVNIINTK